MEPLQAAADILATDVGNIFSLYLQVFFKLVFTAPFNNPVQFVEPKAQIHHPKVSLVTYLI